RPPVERFPARRSRPGRSGLARRAGVSLGGGTGPDPRRRGRFRLVLLGRTRLPRALPRALGRLHPGADIDLAVEGRLGEMKRYAALYGRMLRYRVAAMVWMFMLLAAARAEGLTRFSWDYIWATIALASSYVTATAVNDIADEQIDLVNHPRDNGRPLVSGDASPRDLYRLHAVAAGLALASAVAIGRAAVAVIACSLAIAWAYSLPPLRFSYRTYLAPLVLGIAYVGVPYELGTLAAGGHVDFTFAAALFALFVARINLKDFRDRRGDALYGRPTLLLRFGKDVTCLVSLLALIVGNALLLSALEPPVAVAATLQLYVLAIASMLLSLREASEGRL